MKITERFKKIFPTAQVHWNYNINQLSLHFMNQKINEEEIKLKVYIELNFARLLRAVDSVKILGY